MRALLGILALALALTHAPFAGAGAAPMDEGLLAQLEVVSAQLRSEPQRTDLLLRRADLLRRYGRHAASLADAQRAARLDPQLPGPDLARARTLRDAGHPYRALVALGRHLRRLPTDRTARRERAALLARLGRAASAAAELSALLEEVERPNPDLWLARHRLLLELGQRERALAGLEQGLAKLGSLVSLELPALELEQELGRHGAALQRIERVAASVPRLDGWHLHRAEVLEAAGREDQARAAYQAAATALRALSPRRRSTAAAQTLLAEAEAGLRRLSSDRDASRASSEPDRQPRRP